MVERKNVQYALIIFVAGAVASYLFLSVEMGNKDAAIAEKQAEIEFLDRQVSLFRDLSDEWYYNAQKVEGRLDERIKKRLLNVEGYPAKQGLWFSQMITFTSDYEDGRITKVEAERYVGQVLQDNWFDASIYLADEGLFSRNQDWFEDIHSVTTDYKSAEINETTARKKILNVVNGGKEKKVNIINDGAWFSYMSGSKECEWVGFFEVEFPIEEYRYGGISEGELRQIFNWLLYDYWFDGGPKGAFKALNDDAFFKELLYIFEGNYYGNLTEYEGRESINTLVQSYLEPEQFADQRVPLYQGFWYQKILTYIREYNWLRFSEEKTEGLVLGIITGEWFGGNITRGEEFSANNPGWFDKVFDIVFKSRAGEISEAEARDRVQSLVSEGRAEELTILINGVWFNEMSDIMDSYRTGNVSRGEAEKKINGISIYTWFGRGSDDAYVVLNAPEFFRGMVTIFDEHSTGTLKENEARERISELMQ